MNRPNLFDVQLLWVRFDLTQVGCPNDNLEMGRGGRYQARTLRPIAPRIPEASPKESSPRTFDHIGPDDIQTSTMESDDTIICAVASKVSGGAADTTEQSNVEAIALSPGAQTADDRDVEE